MLFSAIRSLNLVVLDVFITWENLDDKRADQNWLEHFNLDNVVEAVGNLVKTLRFVRYTLSPTQHVRKTARWSDLAHGDEFLDHGLTDAFESS